MARKPKIGLALGSGGARGWCHIGVLRGLAALGVEIDVVAGTSIGALVGAAFAGGRLDALESWVRGLTQRKLVSLVDPSLRSGGLVEARQIETMLGEIGLAARIEDLGLPYTAIATDMETGREVWLNEGPTFRAVRASVGIPGVMSPVRLDDRWLLDGGLVNPVPVSAARALGAEIIIAVNPNARRYGKFWKPPDPRPGFEAWVGQILPDTLHKSLGIDPTKPGHAVVPNYFDVLTTAIDVMTDTIRRARVAGEPPHVELNAYLNEISVLELHRGAEAISEGERIVRANAALIRDVCALG
ncbi:MAG TPA: patatin [Rhodobacteraceae bacterium]|nr:patatin [Paracoccaceae bacterium]